MSLGRHQSLPIGRPHRPLRYPIHALVSLTGQTMKMIVVGLAMITMAVVFGGATAAEPETSAKPPRFAPLTPDQLNVYQKPLGEQIMKVSSVGLGGPYNPLLRSPVLGQRMFDLLYYLRSAAKMRASRAS